VRGREFYITGAFLQKLYTDAPDCKIAIEAGRDVWYLWFALRDWHGGNSEVFFGELGS
jgi:hypothetical protein